MHAFKLDLPFGYRGETFGSRRFEKWLVLLLDFEGGLLPDVSLVSRVGSFDSNVKVVIIMCV